jgi:hypothetical protein
MRLISRILLFFACAWLAACSTQEVYTGESFASDSPFKMRVDGDVAPACESARRSLMGQGYLIESASEEGIKARKATRGGETQNTFIEMNVVCLPDSHGSTLFATGVLTTYALKKSSSSASVGVSALGSISLPIGQSADSLVKISEETIDDKDFYGRFFAAVSNTLEEMEAGKAPPEEPSAPAAAEPAAVMPAPAVEPVAPAQVAQPGAPTTSATTPGISAPGVATPLPVQSAPATSPAPQPAVATTPPVTGPASTTVLPESPATPETPSFTPEPGASEQAPTYTLQPDAAPAASPEPQPGAEQPPAPALDPIVDEAAPEPAAAEQAPAAPEPVVGAGEPAATPAPEPEPKAPAAEVEPVVDNDLLFL